MRTHLLLLALAAGCLDSGGKCACLVRNPAIVVQVEDASTHAEVAAPTFSVNGQAVQAESCTTTSAADAWCIYEIPGSYSVTVAAPSYAPQTIEVVVPELTQTDCCPIVNDAHATVALTPSP
jgi:hypothetical protein